MNKLLVICGPTATAKTTTAIYLSKKFNGELVSADSRQVYQGMDIGTGKDLPKNAKLKVKNAKLKVKEQTYLYGFYELEGIPLWLVDLARPDQQFSVAHYQEVASKTINDISKRGYLPIVVGGSGLYIESLVNFPKDIHIPPNQELRQDLSHKKINQLQQRLKNINPSRWKMMNRSDRMNPRRLIRAIEISLFKRVPLKKLQRQPLYKDILIIGLKAPFDKLYQRIDDRVDKRLKQGIIKEIRNLLMKGYGFNLPAMNTLGYKEWRLYFKGKKTKAEVINKWKFNEHAYARRQLTYFKKQANVYWFDMSKNYQHRIEELVKAWYTR